MVISKYYALTFTLKFDHDKDTVFIAFSRPYKYSKIILNIMKLENKLMHYDPDQFSEKSQVEPAKFDH